MGIGMEIWGDRGRTVWERHDEVVDFGVLAGLEDIFVCGGGFVDAEKDVFSDGALVEGWFLGDEGEGFAVFGDVHGGEFGAVVGYASRLVVVESDKLVSCRS
jgi:hypothetical protein